MPKIVADNYHLLWTYSTGCYGTLEEHLAASIRAQDALPQVLELLFDICLVLLLGHLPNTVPGMVGRENASGLGSGRVFMDYDFPLSCRAN